MYWVRPLGLAVNVIFVFEQSLVLVSESPVNIGALINAVFLTGVQPGSEGSVSTTKTVELPDGTGE